MELSRTLLSRSSLLYYIRGTKKNIQKASVINSAGHRQHTTLVPGQSRKNEGVARRKETPKMGRAYIACALGLLREFHSPCEKIKGDPNASSLHEGLVFGRVYGSLVLSDFGVHVQDWRDQSA